MLLIPANLLAMNTKLQEITPTTASVLLAVSASQETVQVLIYVLQHAHLLLMMTIASAHTTLNAFLLTAPTISACQLALRTTLLDRILMGASARILQNAQHSCAQQMSALPIVLPPKPQASILSTAPVVQMTSVSLESARMASAILHAKCSQNSLEASSTTVHAKKELSVCQECAQVGSARVTATLTRVPLGHMDKDVIVTLTQSADLTTALPTRSNAIRLAVTPTLLVSIQTDALATLTPNALLAIAITTRFARALATLLARLRSMTMGARATSTRSASLTSATLRDSATLPAPKSSLLPTQTCATAKIHLNASLTTVLPTSPASPAAPSLSLLDHTPSAATALKTLNAPLPSAITTHASLLAYCSVVQVSTRVVAIARKIPTATRTIADSQIVNVPLYWVVM